MKVLIYEPLYFKLLIPFTIQWLYKHLFIFKPYNPTPQIFLFAIVVYWKTSLNGSIAIRSANVPVTTRPAHVGPVYHYGMQLSVAVAVV